METILYIPLLSDYPMIITLLGLFIGGFLTLIAGRFSEISARALAILSILGGLFLNALLLFRIWNGGSVFHDITWLGDTSSPIMTLGFLGDGLSTPIAILILGLGLLSVSFSFFYMKELRNAGHYYSLMVWFIAAMVGVVYTSNLMQFFIFYEMMLIPAFLLVYLYGTSKNDEERAKNALQFWVWTFAGGLVSLFGVFMLYGVAGTMEIAELYTASIALDTARLIGIVFLLGFGMKLGLFPLHVWAPPAYEEAPIPILALLSGAMTKTAAYGVVRIVIPVFSEALRGLSTGLMLISLITMVYGAMLAISQKDLKMMLAYSSISQLGYLMFGYSSMTLIGLSGAAFQIVNHSILSSMMFFCGGAIEMKTGTLEFNKLGGLAPKMPALGAVFVIGSLALAGTPPLSAFAGEWMIFAGAAERVAFGGIGQLYYLAMTIFGIIATALTAGYYLWAIRRIFYGPIREGLENVSDPPIAILSIVGLMALVIVAIGVWPWMLWRFVNPVLSALYGGG